MQRSMMIVAISLLALGLSVAAGPPALTELDHVAASAAADKARLIRREDDATHEDPAPVEDVEDDPLLEESTPEADSLEANPDEDDSNLPGCKLVGFFGTSISNCSYCPGEVSKDRISCDRCPEGFFKPMTADNLLSIGRVMSDHCFSCADGIQAEDRHSCDFCQPGFVKHFQENKCVRCPGLTKRWGDKAASNCDRCPQGKFKQDPDVDECTMCFGEIVRDHDGWDTDCRPCPPGHYKPSQNIDQCEVCPGIVLRNGSHTACQPCPDDGYHYKPDVNSDLCERCPGRLAFTDGKPVCTACPVGRFMHHIVHKHAQEAEKPEPAVRKGEYDLEDEVMGEDNNIHESSLASESQKKDSAGADSLASEGQKKDDAGPDSPPAAASLAAVSVGSGASMHAKAEEKSISPHKNLDSSLAQVQSDTHNKNKNKHESKHETKNEDEDESKNKNKHEAKTKHEAKNKASDKESEKESDNATHSSADKATVAAAGNATSAADDEDPGLTEEHGVETQAPTEGETVTHNDCIICPGYIVRTNGIASDCRPCPLGQWKKPGTLSDNCQECHGHVVRNKEGHADECRPCADGFKNIDDEDICVQLTDAEALDEGDMIKMDHGAVVKEYHIYDDFKGHHKVGHVVYGPRHSMEG